MFFLVSFIDFLFRTTPKNTSTVPDGAVAATSTEVPRKRSQIVSRGSWEWDVFFGRKIRFTDSEMQSKTVFGLFFLLEKPWVRLDQK